MLNEFILLHVITIIANVILFIYVVIKYIRNRVAKSYLFIIFSIVLWSTCESLEAVSTNIGTATTIQDIAVFAACLIGPALTLFIVSVAYPELNRKSIVTCLLFLPVILITYFQFTEHNFTHVIMKDWGYGVKPGIWYIYLGIFVAGTSALSIIFALFALQKLNDLQKKQLNIFIFAFLIPIIGGTYTEIIVPLNHINIFPMTNILLGLTTFIIFYGIQKYEIFSITPALALGQIFDTLTDILIVLDEKGHIAMINNPVEELIEYPRDELIGKDISQILQKQDGSFFTNEAITTMELKNIRMSLLTKKNKRRIPVVVTGSSIRRDKLVIGKVLAIRDMRQIDDLINDINEMQSLDKAKDEFFSIASHELRTPLTAIRGNSSMLLNIYKDKLDDSNITQMIEDIHDSSIRLINVVNDFLNVSRLEQHKIEFMYELFNVGDLTNEIITEMQTNFQGKNINVYKEIINDELPMVYADRKQVKDIIVNLVDNAIKYTNEGSVALIAKHDGTLISISVKDTGKGISPDDQQKLFKKFQQGTTNYLERDTAKSTGLGLYMSKLTAEQMGGTLFLEQSKENEGSTFVFYLPITPPDKKLHYEIK